MRNKDSKNKFVSIVLITFFVFGLFSFNTFEGGICAGVTWTYNSSTNTATASGTGTTNFSELVQADIDGGWGGIFTADTTGTQILCKGKIVVGDGTNTITWTDSGLNIFFDSVPTANFQTIITVSAKASITFGFLESGSKQYGTRGCNFIVNTTYTGVLLVNAWASTAKVYLYGCSFSQYGSGVRCYLQLHGGGTVYNCLLSRGMTFSYCTGVDFNNVQVLYCTDTSTSVFQTMVSCTFNNFVFSKIYGVTYVAGSDSLTLRNIVVLDNTYSVRTNNVIGNQYFVNAIMDSWSVSWYGTNTGKVFRQYTFNLNVLNGNITDFVENATVQLWKDSNLIYEGTTNSSGMIPTQTLTYGYYQQSTGDTIQNATSPYYLVISHPDWQTYVSRFYITEPLRLTVSMQEPTVTGYTEVEKSDYTTIILFVISLILCIMGLALAVPLLPLISLTISVINIIFLSEPTIFNILLIILNVTFTVIALVRAKTKNN